MSYSILLFLIQGCMVYIHEIHDLVKSVGFLDYAATWLIEFGCVNIIPTYLDSKDEHFRK